RPERGRAEDRRGQARLRGNRGRRAGGARAVNVPDLAAIVREMPTEELPALVGRLAEAEAVAIARLTAPGRNDKPAVSPRCCTTGPSAAARRSGRFRPSTQAPSWNRRWGRLGGRSI